MASNKTKNVLYVFEHGPYSTSAGIEALDAALVGASFELNISLLFLYDGVFQLKRQQVQTSALVKQYTKTFGALQDFDIHNIFVHDLSLIARGLEKQDLMISAESLSSHDISALIAGQDKVFTF